MKIALALVLLAGCDHALDQRLAIVDEPRVLAITATPAEARPGAQVTYTALVATPDGPGDPAATTWAFCTAGKPPTEDNAVAPACLGDNALARLGAGPSITAALPADACSTFGPDVPSGSGSDLRPRDPDPTGGYYQPVRADLDDLTAFGLSRVTCNLPTAPPDVAHAYQTMYIANAAPTPAAPQLLVDGAPASSTIPAGAEVTVVASWPPAAAEDYLWFDPDTQTLATRHESMRVSWFATAGALDVDAGGVAEDDRATTSVSTTWHAPTTPGPATLWLVYRDARGGIATQTIAVTVQ